MSCVAARHDAVKKVYAAVNRLENIDGSTHTHQIADFVFGSERLDRLDYLIHNLGRLADSQSADCVAVEVKLCDFLHVIDSQVAVGAALIDAEQHLLRINRAFGLIKLVHFCNAPFQPACSSRNAVAGVLVGRRVFYALVERHSDC